MSASLVGSEMCIRDRLSTPRSSKPSATSMWKPSAASLAWMDLARPEEVAVSYTHLTLPTICSV
eukprot:1456751-Alexandrium_andersonii.AAC.1